MDEGNSAASRTAPPVAAASRATCQATLRPAWPLARDEEGRSVALLRLPTTNRQRMDGLLLCVAAFPAASLPPRDDTALAHVREGTVAVVLRSRSRSATRRVVRRAVLLSV